MEDDVGTDFLENGVHAHDVIDVSDENTNINVGGNRTKFSFEKELAVFGTVDQNDLFGRELE